MVSRKIKGCFVWIKLFCGSGSEQTPAIPGGCSVVAINFMILLLTTFIDIFTLSKSFNMCWDEVEHLKASVIKTVYNEVLSSSAAEIIRVPSIKNSLPNFLYFLCFRDLKYFILDLEIILSVKFLYM